MTWLLALLLAQDESVLKVYITDKDHHVLSLKDVDCRVILEIDGVGRQALKTSLAETDKPAGRKNHGGDVDDRDGYFVELAIDAPLKDDDPHVEAKSPLSGLACAMRCQFVDKQGPCPKCGMKVMKQPYYFTAVVVFRISGEPRNVRFRVPPPSESIKEAVESLETLVNRMSETDIRKPIVDRIVWLAERIRELEPQEAKLAEALGQLASSGASPEAYKDKVIELKKRLK